MSLRVVTDSTCDIPEELQEEFGITVIPAHINIGNDSYLDGVDLSRAALYEGLPHFNEHPTTAAPSPGTFTETYNQLASEGATEIISIHVAARLSGMLNAARVGSEAADNVSVTLFDSEQLTMGLGLMVIAAAKAARDGQSMDDIVAMLESRSQRTYVFGLLDTLEYLRRSGRVNWAVFGIGTLLRIKPLIKVHKAEIEMLDKVRTSKKALDRFIELVSDLAPFEDIALLHTHSLDKLDSFRERMQFLIPNGVSVPAVELTPALGVHIGPGGLGIAFTTIE
ncbi:MAG TPA: DegV family protein [candidate division Zixibacteria bacterium]|nr:DegV family protein [candidate division Zixibacteria bacterium]